MACQKFIQTFCR